VHVSVYIRLHEPLPCIPVHSRDSGLNPLVERYLLKVPCLAKCRWLTSAIPATQEGCGSKPAQGSSLRDPISKSPSQKRADGVVHVVACLPSNCEVLDSNPSTMTKKKGLAP
jgi:hypothetical protein